MPVQVSYPGVYIQEVPSGVRTITGVSTSVAAFVGMARRGRMFVPTRVLSFADYGREFGNDTQVSEMTDQVRQFFQNGGRQAFVTRIATGHASASVGIENAGSDAVVLTLTAQDAGVDGNMIRAEVDYDTPTPESTFNLRVLRHAIDPFGALVVEAQEDFSNLSMDPSDGHYIETIVNQQSNLVEAAVSGTINTDVPPFAGYSLSGLLIDAVAPFDPAGIRDELNLITSGGASRIQISVDGSPFATVTLQELLDTVSPFSEWQSGINSALNPFGASVTVDLVAGPTGTQYLRFVSDNTSGGSVRITPAGLNDAAVALQLGVNQGGFEVSGYANQRPAPTGFFATLGALDGTGLQALNTFAATQKSNFGDWTMSDSSGGAHSGNPQAITFPGTGSDPMFVGTLFVPTGIFLGSLRNVRENLQIFAGAINGLADGPWTASVQGHRMVLTPTFGGVNSDTSADIISTTYNVGDTGDLFDLDTNVQAYSLGDSGTATDYQSPGTPGLNGGVPQTDQYREAFLAIDRDVDLFNLLILPRADGQTDTERERVWGPASDFCLTRRAFLLIDPRADAGTWATADEVEQEIEQLRIGLVKDHAAIYWPRLMIATNGSTKAIDPSGSIAGLMSRIDANRGVWKAPAGIEAGIRGVRGIERTMTDRENGLINPAAVNALRVFPNGIVSWGARTMDGFDNSGNDDYKYVPVRRIALFLEESLFRGLKFAVFQPNDEPLWALIRLAAGAFMNNLFRQGAFQGQKASDAYFVKVDSETTTQNDINLGIVNVVVGFAPLKPAEFVVITIQQKAGQIQV